MAGRAQAFSDPAVIQLLSERFIPVAENCSPLQRQPDAKGQFFRLVAEQGHYGGRTFPTATRQGHYAFTAAGALLASVNTRDAANLTEMLQRALERWAEHADTQGEPPAGYAPAHPSRYPEGGLVLHLAARDLPRERDDRPEDWRKHAWNMDYAWFTREEAQSLVPQSREPGARRAAPSPVVRRLARFHLRDIVRGEPPAWPEEAVRHAELNSEVVGVRGGQVDLRLTGAARIATVLRWNDAKTGLAHESDAGYDCALYGEATWDEGRVAFTACDLLAAGQRWGTAQYNVRADDLGPAPLGIAFGLAGSAPRDHTPPHTIRSDYFGDQ